MASNSPGGAVVIGPYKVLLLGNAAVGKSCLFRRFVSEGFETDYFSTIGIDFGLRTVALSESRLIQLQIWDTAGQERFRGLARNYFRGADAVLLVYDLTDFTSYEGLEGWTRQLLECSCALPGIVIGNKLDLAGDRAVSLSQGKDFAKKHNLRHVEASAKTGENLDLILYELCETFWRNADKSRMKRKGSEGENVDLLLTGNGDSGGSKCCFKR